MNRKQFILVLLALAVIGGAGLILLSRNKQSWSVREAKMGDKVLPRFRLNDVAAIHIKDASDLTIERVNGIWRVRERGDYPANYGQVRKLLMTMRDLKVVQCETVGISQLAYVDLEAPEKKTGAGTLLEFKDQNGKTMDSLLVGKKHMRAQDGSFSLRSAFDGRYVRLPGDLSNVILVSEELASITSEPEMWLNTDFFKIENAKSISLFSTNSLPIWKISRQTESGEWRLADSKPGDVLDESALSRVAEVLAFPTFIDVVSNPKADNIALSNPLVLNVETFDSWTYSLKIGDKNSEGNYWVSMVLMPGKTDEAKTAALREKLAKEQALAPWVYVMDSRLIDPLIVDRSKIVQNKTVARE